MMSYSSAILNGCATGLSKSLVKDKIVRILSASEYTQRYTWICNPQSGQLNANNNNNNKNYSYVVRPVLALESGTIKGWMDAYADCIKKKMASERCVDFRLHDDDLLRLIEECEGRIYVPYTSTAFIITRPKLREIFAAGFRDRIVQHWICLRIEPLFEKRFSAQGNVSWNCRKGCGTGRAVEVLRKDINDVSDDYRREAWIGRFDIRLFFMSIDICILERLVVAFVDKYYMATDKDLLLYLLVKTIRHRPQDDCVLSNDVCLWRRLPKYKSLFYADRDKGLPIGNITSQLLANFYLSFLDDCMINECRKIGARYERFVDDFAIVCHTKVDVLSLRDKASRFLKDNLNLEMHHDKVYIQEAKKGVYFVGAVIKKQRLYLSNHTVGGLVSRLTEINAWMGDKMGGFSIFDAYRLKHYASSINSYLGFMIGKNAYALKRKIIKRYCPNFFRYLYITKHFMVVKIKKQFRVETILKTKDYE